MSSTSSLHALIIEDDMVIALEVEDLLRNEGFASFDYAMAPTDALRQALARRPDLITADVRIVDGTGIEAVANIRKALGEVPYVFVTGNVEDVRDEDAARVVEKPISMPRFARAVANAGAVRP